MKNLPLGLQSFSKLIENNCVYVDKTKYIYDLIKGNCIFFARPRRFGKSLLCSTLKELFLGKKELFKGLWIYENTDYSWPVHPVIHIDLSQVVKTGPEELSKSLMRSLDDVAKLYKLEKLEHTFPSEMLKDLTINLFEKFGSKNRVVIIIDEYDKPILDNIDKIDIAQSMREVLRNFYEAIKPLDEYLRFVFITGVTRFSKTSIFSGLNQLDNISMDQKHAHLLGYTQEEIVTYFGDHLNKIVREKMISSKDGIEELKILLCSWYNGYRFWGEQQVIREKTERKELARVYSPFSVLNFLEKEDLRNYWFESGTPSFLIKVLEKNNYPIELFENLQADMNELMTFDINNIPLATLLFQTGYATIKDYDVVYQRYSIVMPNYEVKDSLLKSILTGMTKHSTSTINAELIDLRVALDAEDLETFIDKIKKFYSTIPYTIAIDKEKYYQTIFFLILKLVNLKPEVEKATNIGRIDLIAQTNKILYLFEFKLNGSAQMALQQIFDMKYYEAYQGQGKKIKLVGVNFSSEVKNITEYLYEDLV